jgi:hypothetical protein
MTHDEVQAWLDRYVAAWRSYDPAAIGDLFSVDAAYRYHPWDEPTHGRETIVRDWLEPNGNASGRDQAGTYAATYRPYAVDGRRAVAVGTSDYLDVPGGALERRYHNVFLLVFDEDGRCREFTELFMLAPGA